MGRAWTSCSSQCYPPTLGELEKNISTRQFESATCHSSKPTWGNATATEGRWWWCWWWHWWRFWWRWWRWQCWGREKSSRGQRRFQTGSNVGLGNGSRISCTFYFFLCIFLYHTNCVLLWVIGVGQWLLTSFDLQKRDRIDAGVYYKAGEGPPLEEPLSLNEFCNCPIHTISFWGKKCPICCLVWS